MNGSKLFGEWLRKTRKQQGLSIGQVADAVGIKPCAFDKIERGQRPPPSFKGNGAVYLGLAVQLNCHLGELAYWALADQDSVTVHGIQSLTTDQKVALLHLLLREDKEPKDG